MIDFFRQPEIIIILNGEYRITVYLQDTQGNISQPRSVQILQSGRDGREHSTASLYDPENALLTLKDVEYAGQHYYVELKDLGGYLFELRYLQPLSGAVLEKIARYDGQQVNIPNLLAFGHYYSVQLQLQEGGFGLLSVGAAQ